jgi:tRNA (cmo5U34)-methyltransferase
LLGVWFTLMKGNGVSLEELEKMREAYTRDVAVLPPQHVREIIMGGGFELPVLFFQTGLIHAWYAKRPGK